MYKTETKQVIAKYLTERAALYLRNGDIMYLTEKYLISKDGVCQWYGDLGTKITRRLHLPSQFIQIDDYGGKSRLVSKADIRLVELSSEQEDVIETAEVVKWISG